MNSRAKRAAYIYYILYYIILYYINDENYQENDDFLRSAHIYCFRAELSAEGAKRVVEKTPEVFPPNNLPRPSRPKAGLGLVTIMMMMMTKMKMIVR